ncbi:hypothetical protein CesoFtcFv8_021223 [Champsocephalus esox]|uniref:Uncharacterized protein n=2 Tax=Champsocephalus TaxID=52236 RepID=A0AAN8CR45_CHAGU|nr:hypothetical protein CesoFtcFv8_021223 [Champsocephalus esox]KAK5908711.1 hypothetical protein CgunFtcFv8_016744 [Champsocephalus gunnari]
MGWGVQSCLHGNLKHGVTDVVHPAVHLLPLLSPNLIPLLLFLTVLSTVPVVPNAALWDPDGTLMGVCMAYGPFTHVAERFACLCPKVPQREEPPPHTTSRIPPP